ncbi:hypothetical protein SCARD494_03408 [Seiridium cardinale]
MASSAGARAPGLHTPTQSFSSPPADMVIQSHALHLNDKKKLKEEVDIAKQRLSDTKFNIRDYPDPLLPREVPRERHIPSGVTTEREKYLLDVIAKVKAAQK